MKDRDLAQLAVMAPWFKGASLYGLVGRYGHKAVWEAFSKSNAAITNSSIKFRVGIRLIRISRRWRMRFERLQRWLGE